MEAGQFFVPSARYDTGLIALAFTYVAVARRAPWLDRAAVAVAQLFAPAAAHDHHTLVHHYEQGAMS
jgi:hypothetical protein